jgi:hypothetical protein
VRLEGAEEEESKQEEAARRIDQDVQDLLRATGQTTTANVNGTNINVTSASAQIGNTHVIVANIEAP